MQAETRDDRYTGTCTVAPGATVRVSTDDPGIRALFGQVPTEKPRR